MPDGREIYVEKVQWDKPKDLQERLDVMREALHKRAVDLGHDPEAFDSIICDGCGATVTAPAGRLSIFTEKWRIGDLGANQDYCPICAKELH